MLKVYNTRLQRYRDYKLEFVASDHFPYICSPQVGRGGSEQRIPAHKFVLSVGSAVFDAMFNSTLATQEDEITIPDVEPAAFLSLLKFLYRQDALQLKGLITILVKWFMRDIFVRCIGSCVLNSKHFEIVKRNRDNKHNFCNFYQ